MWSSVGLERGGLRLGPPRPWGRARAQKGSSSAESALAGRIGVDHAFRFTRTLLPPRDAVSGEQAALSADDPLVAVAGIARPRQFFDGLRRAGRALAATAAFRDHCAYTPRHVARIAALAAAHGAAHVVTTEKDLVRLLPLAPFPFSLLALPLRVEIEPREAFRAWLGGRVKQARVRTR